MGREELDQLENSSSVFISQNSSTPLFQHANWGKIAALKAI